ncbi:MAG: efflux RND transporter periplasmic adaptor subunit [Acidobacteriota bacterium]|jgi:multidrug resistance efflux pump
MTHLRRSIPARFAVLSVLAAAVLAACACGGGASGTAAAAADGPDDLVVRRGPFEQTFLLSGELEAARAIRLTVPRTPSWRVEIRWLAEDGSLVEEGDRLVQLDNSEFVSDLEDKEVSLEEKLSELERKEAEILEQVRQKEFDVERARAELEKAQIEADLPEGIIPRQDLADRRLELEKATDELEKARAELAAEREASEADLEIQRIEIEKSRREIEIARESIERLSLTAVTDGLFLVGELPWEDRTIQVGDTVWAGLTVGTIPDLSSLRVRARLPDVDDGRVRAGMPARVVLDAYPDDVLAGEVTRVAPIAREEGSESLRRSFEVEVALETVDPERMIPGMSARVEVVRAARQEALIVPRAAVLADRPAAADDGDRSGRVRRADGDLVPVRLGPCDALECVVDQPDGEGLAPGQRLARAGAAHRDRAGPAAEADREAP